MFYIPKKNHDIAMKMPGLDAADALVSATREKKTWDVSRGTRENSWDFTHKILDIVIEWEYHGCIYIYITVYCIYNRLDVIFGFVNGGYPKMVS